jgi:hypothetical protein
VRGEMQDYKRPQGHGPRYVAYLVCTKMLIMATVYRVFQNETPSVYTIFLQKIVLKGLSLCLEIPLFRSYHVTKLFGLKTILVAQDKKYSMAAK